MEYQPKLIDTVSELMHGERLFVEFKGKYFYRQDFIGGYKNNEYRRYDFSDSEHLEEALDKAYGEMYGMTYHEHNLAEAWSMKEDLIADQKEKDAASKLSRSSERILNIASQTNRMWKKPAEQQLTGREA